MKSYQMVFLHEIEGFDNAVEELGAGQYIGIISIKDLEAEASAMSNAGEYEMAQQYIDLKSDLVSKGISFISIDPNPLNSES